jgi:alpha-ribazole phosphatase
LKNPQENQLKKYSKNNSLIFLLRHGQIKGCSEKRYIGKTDIDLDNTGVLQAEYWRNQFSSIKLNTIYSSSLTRSKDTLEIIAENTEIITDTALNEINMGTWDGKTFAEIKTGHPEEFKKRGEIIDTFRPPKGESFYDLSCRALPFFENLGNKIQGNILVVTHAGVIRTFLSSILKIELKNLFQIKVSYGQLFVISNDYKSGKT